MCWEDECKKILIIFWYLWLLKLLQLLELLWKLLVRISHKKKTNSLQRPSSWERKEDRWKEVEQITKHWISGDLQGHKTEDGRRNPIIQWGRQLQALKNNKGLKSIKTKKLLGRNNIVSLKEEDGTLIRDFNRMIQRCEEFYTKLYSTRQVRQSSVPALPATYEPPPPILPSEVRVAIKRLKRGKAPGGITSPRQSCRMEESPSLRRSSSYSTDA